MPTITRNKEREREIIEKLAARLGPVHREGEHLTEAVKCNVLGWGIEKLTEAGIDLHFDEGSILRMTKGQLWGTLLEEGEVSQIRTISADDDSVGTIDIWRGFVVDVKSTEISTNHDIGEQDYWMMQLGGYVARNLREGAQTAKAELWVIHEKGDHGKMRCSDHGYPEQNITALYEPTGRRRKICPECREFLVAGNSNPAFRVYNTAWTRDELESLHRIITSRLAQNAADKANPEYFIGNPPPIRHGYDFECPNCIVKELIDCPGRGAADDLEEKLAGSIMELQEVKT